jgi:hypothetical protein
MRSSVIVFGRNDVVPHIRARDTHRWSRKISIATQKDFCNTIGTKRTRWRGQTMWDPIRAEHSGQRPYLPHRQAGQVTEPDQCCGNVRKVLARAPSTRDLPRTSQANNAADVIVTYLVKG